MTRSQVTAQVVQQPQQQDEPRSIRGAVAPSTYDAKAGTVEVVFSTGAAVRRYNWRTGSYWMEELGMDPSNIDLSRFNAGAPVVDSHSTWGIRNVLGVVEKAWVEGGQGRALVRFDLNGEAGAEAARMVSEGILRNWSVGYDVEEWQDVTTEQDRTANIQRRRAKKWQPAELSLVPVNADQFSQSRSADQNTPVELPPHTDMTKQTMGGAAPGAAETRTAPAADHTGPAAAPAAAPVAVADPAAEARGAQAERQRGQAIRAEFARHKLTGSQMETECLDQGLSLDQARVRLLDHLAAEQTRTEGGPVRGAVSFGKDERSKVVESAEAVILARATGNFKNLSPEARDMRHMGLLDLGRECLERSGVNTRSLSREAIAKASLARVPQSIGLFQRAGGGLSTSDFPAVLANVATKSLQKSYEEAPQEWREFVAIDFLPDFKQAKSVRLSDAPALQKIAELGEYKLGSLGDQGENIQLEKHGVLVRMSWEALINDDLSAFTKILPAMGRRAREKETQLVFSVLNANPTMADTKALFGSGAGSHLNLGSGVIAEAGLTAAWTAIRKQIDINGSKLSLTPKFLVVPTALRQLADAYVGTVQPLYPDAASKVNTHRGKYTVVDSPWLDDSSPVAWYMLCGKDTAPVIQLTYLTGEQGPVLMEDESFTVDAMSWKVRMVAVANAIDWRGGYKSSGS